MDLQGRAIDKNRYLGVDGNAERRMYGIEDWVASFLKMEGVGKVRGWEAEFELFPGIAEWFKGSLDGEGG